MRSSTFSTFAILATSLLAKEALAGRYDVRKRAALLEVVTDSVIVIEQATVTEEPDGSYETGLPVVIGTTTIDGIPVVVSSTELPVSPEATAPAPVKAAVQESSTASPSSAAVFFQEPKIAPAPATRPAASTSSTTLAVPTTFATSTTSSSSSSISSTSSASSTSTSISSTSSSSTSSSSIPPSSTSSTAAPASTATSTSSGDKRGLAYNDPSLLSGFLGANSKTSWCYNWGSTSGGIIPSSLEYVPMLWGLASSSTSGWAAAASSAIASGSSHLLSFNEPDLSSQSNLGYAEAASGYKTYMQPFAGKAKLGAPAVTNGAADQGMGTGWLTNFLQACDGCTIDFVPFHWYGSATDPDSFMSYVSTVYTASGNRPLWITEFGASGTADEQQTFLDTVMPWLDSQSYVERYAYFMVSDGNLLSSGSALSALGNTFAFSS